MARPDVAGETKRYLETGEHDMLFLAWTGENTVDRLNRGHAARLDALVAEMKRRGGQVNAPDEMQGLDLALAVSIIEIDDGNVSVTSQVLAV